MRLAVLRTGRSIKYEANQSLREFAQFVESLSDSEQFDLFLIYQYLCLRLRREENVNNVRLLWWEQRFLALINLCSESLILDSKASLGLHSLAEQKGFAHQMLDNFWREVEF